MCEKHLLFVKNTYLFCAKKKNNMNFWHNNQEIEIMKNILGTTEELELFNKDGRRVYQFIKNSNGFICEYTRDSNGKVLTYKNSNGYSYEYTYDSRGNILTYKNSNGVTRGFDIPEYTMEELVKKLGNFKIKK